MKETGVRNGAHGADKFGFKNLAGVHWNLPAAPLYEHAIRNGEAAIVCRRRALRRDRPSHRPQPEGQAHRRRCADREHRLVGRQSQAAKEHFDNLLDGLSRARQGQDAVRAGSLRRRRSEIPHQGAGLHRICLAFAVHPPASDPPRSFGARSYVPDMTIVDMPSFKAGRQSVTAAATAPTPWWRSISPARSC